MADDVACVPWQSIVGLILSVVGLILSLIGLSRG
jgi:hypothetical protein